MSYGLKGDGVARYNHGVRIAALTLVTSLALLLAAATDKPVDTSKLPNVLFITVDTLRADHLSSYGYHLKTSPRIDQLAAEGVRFNRAHTVVPLTGPSHLSIFTSRYPQEHGARINGTSLPRNSRWLSLPQILHRFDYHSAAFVSSWTLLSRLTQLGRWFDVYEESLPRSYQLLQGSRYAEDVTPVALKWLEANTKKPFFLWVHYFDPHSPYNLREKFADPESSGHPTTVIDPLDEEMENRIRRYDSEIGYADHYIGRLLDRVDRLGLRESTIVVLTSDHGEALGEHGYVGHGRRLSEGIVRVPLMIRYPGKVPAGEVIQEPVSVLDISPTIIEMTGIEKLAIDQQALPWSFAGRSLAGAIRGDEQLPLRTMRYVTFAGQKGIAPRWISWMWVQKAGLPLHLGRTDGSDKMVWTPGRKSLQIIDLQNDPHETERRLLGKGEAPYPRHTAALRRWFESTDLEESEAKLTKRDAEVLESLGYIQ
jgi:arylsulfatase A-like enzyme